jgi:hypothetical protein
VQIRVTTKASLPYDVGATVVSVAALSAALLLPPFGKPLSMVAAIALLVLTPMSIARQRKGEADFRLVSVSDRRAFIAADTALALAVLASVGTAFFLIYTVPTTSVRVGVGHLALLSGVLAHAARIRNAMKHAERVCPPG